MSSALHPPRARAPLALLLLGTTSMHTKASVMWHAACPARVMRHAACPARAPTSCMGLFDSIKQAFDEAESMSGKKSARASHILMKNSLEALLLKEKVDSGEISFSEAARQYSSCPSSSKGGSLGQFGPGAMTPAFDALVFDPDTQIDEVNLVTTSFGTHLVKVVERSGVQQTAPAEVAAKAEKDAAAAAAAVDPLRAAAEAAAAAQVAAQVAAQAATQAATRLAAVKLPDSTPPSPSPVPVPVPAAPAATLAELPDGSTGSPPGTSTPTASEGSSARSPRERMIELNELLSAELITPEEFDAKRKAILSSL